MVAEALEATDQVAGDVLMADAVQVALLQIAVGDVALAVAHKVLVALYEIRLPSAPKRAADRRVERPGGRG